MLQRLGGVLEGFFLFGLLESFLLSFDSEFHLVQLGVDLVFEGEHSVFGFLLLRSLFSCFQDEFFQKSFNDDLSVLVFVALFHSELLFDFLQVLADLRLAKLICGFLQLGVAQSFDSYAFRKGRLCKRLGLFLVLLLLPTQLDLIQ